MYRLIINTKSDFDAAICEQLVNAFGKLEVIPYSDRFCIVQAIEIKDKNWLFNRAITFMLDHPESVLKMLLTASNEEMDSQVDLLQKIALNGFFSKIEPHQYVLGNNVKLKDNLWAIVPLEFEKYDC